MKEFVEAVVEMRRLQKERFAQKKGEPLDHADRQALLLQCKSAERKVDGMATVLSLQYANGQEVLF